MVKVQSFIERFFYSWLFFLAAAIFGFHYLVSGQAVYGDGIGYYAHLHSWVIDGDWDYTNEYTHVYTPTNNNRLEPELSPTIQIVATTAEGTAENHYSPGMAVLLLPFYLLAHGLSVVGSAGGLGLPTHGFGDVYQVVSGLAAVGYVILGLWLVEQLLMAFGVTRMIRRLTVLAVFLATPLLYYGSFDVLNSHFGSFFLSCLWFYVLLRWPVEKQYSAVLGVVAGLLASNRPQDGAVVIVWAVSIWSYVGQELPGTSLVTKLKWLLPHLGWFGGGMVVGLVPLLVHWSHVFASPTQHTYLRNLVIDYQRQPSLNPLGSLVDLGTGLARTPFLLVALGYYAFQLQRRRANNYALVALFFVLQYAIITIQGGWRASAYGGRMYLSTLPFFAVLLADLLEWLQANWSTKAAVLVTLFFSLLNLSMMGHFIVLEKNTEGGGKGTEQRTKERLKQFGVELP